MKHFVGGLVIALVSSVFTFVFGHEPRVSLAAARDFLPAYYAKVVDEQIAEAVYVQSTTDGYRNFKGKLPEDAKIWWAKVDFVKLSSIDPISQPNAFRVTRVIKMVGQPPQKAHEFTYALVCSDWRTRLPFFDCPQESIQLDAVSERSTDFP